MKRPTCVTIVAVLLWLTGALNIIGGLGSMDDLSAFAGLFQVAIGVAAILFGIGCWQLKKWAWLGTIILMGLNAASIIAIWIQYSDRIIVSRVLWPLIINVVVVFYLLQPNIKAAFKK